MADFILVTDDEVFFNPVFGIATVVVVQPGKLTGSAKVSLNGKQVCVEGDEKQVKVPCTYTAGSYSIAGAGVLKIQALSKDQKAQNYSIDNKTVLLKGGQFDAVFEVTIKAQQPSSPPILDTTSQYVGKGYFKTTNTKWTAKCKTSQIKRQVR